MVRKCTVRQASACGMQYWLHPLDGTAAFVISGWMGRLLCRVHPDACCFYMCCRV